MSPEIVFESLFALIGALALILFNRISKDIQKLSDSLEELNSKIGKVVNEETGMRITIDNHGKTLERHEKQFELLGSSRR